MNRRRIVISCVVLIAIGAFAFALIAKRVLKHGGLAPAVSSILSDTKHAIEQWAGEQLIAVSRGYLNPDLTFDSIVYEYPSSVVLINVKLVSDNVTCLEAPSMRVTFTEIPKSGQPIVIQDLELREPTVRLIRRDDGSLIGFSNILRRKDSAEAAVRPRLSDVFAIRRIGVVNGTLEYQQPNRPAMMLDQMTFNLTSTPTGEAPSAEPGWYAIDATLVRQTLFNWAFRGRLNIDTAVLDVGDSNLTMALKPEQYSMLLPQVQSIVRDHEIVGDLTAKVQGTVEFRDSSKTRLNIQTDLTNGRMVFGEYVLPVQSLEIDGQLTGADLALPSIAYRGLGGTIQMSANVKLTSPHATQITIKTEGIRLEDALRPQADQPPKYAGKIDLTGSATANLADLASTADGTGHVDMHEGRLIEIPLISSLSRATKANASNNGSANTDHGSSDVRWRGEQFYFSNIDFVSGAIAARGEGEILFDSSLNFRLNAGPLERLENELGVVGELFGKVTDQLVSYHITGTLAEPIVSVRAFGLGGGQE